MYIDTKMNIPTIEKVIEHEKAHPQRMYADISRGGVWKCSRYNEYFRLWILSGFVEDRSDISERVIHYYQPGYQGWKKLLYEHVDDIPQLNWTPLTSNGVPVYIIEEMTSLQKEINSIRAERDTFRIINTRLNAELVTLRGSSKRA